MVDTGGDTPTISASTTGTRSKDAPTRILDEATRQRRRRKALESLEMDNFREDPHANLVMHKKAPKFEEKHLTEADAASSEYSLTLASIKNRSKAKTIEYLKQRYRKNFSTLLEEDLLSGRPEEEPNYQSARAGPSVYPQRKFCAVCGNFAAYTCVSCGMRYCKLRCLEVHKETRCLKFIA